MPQSLIDPKQNRIISFEKITSYWKDQFPPQKGQKFIDEIFPPITESLLDCRRKTDGVDKINIHEVDWKKAKELFPNTSLSIFPPSNGELKINYQLNNGALFDNYNHFYHAITILLLFPNVIQQIFKTKEVSPDGCYEIYIYTNGEYKILIIDDYFPVIKGTNTLRFAKPFNGELWLLLLEKAFAKISGGYASLISCNMSDVLVAFTGFPLERINLYDCDLEDFEIAIKVNKDSNVISLIPYEESINKGILPKKGYQLLNYFEYNHQDESGNKVLIKLLRIKNMFDYSKWNGDWSKSSSKWEDAIKQFVNYTPEEKEIIYVSLEEAYQLFQRIEVFHPMFDTNTRLIKIIGQEMIKTPQVINLYLNKQSSVSFSMIIKSQSLNIETTTYQHNLPEYNRVTPASLCFSKYDNERSKFLSFEGCFNSYDNCEIARILDEGYYVIWAYLAYEQCREPYPEEYYIKISSNTNFKATLQEKDPKCHLIKQMVLDGIYIHQGQHMKETEIYTMNDNYYNYSGLGLKIINNPFDDCYQKWIFQQDLDNMILLYPYTKIIQFEIEVPNKSNWLILSMKIDNTKKCTFNLKSYFKTLALPTEGKTFSKSEFVFSEFCSKEVKEDELTFDYYDFLNEEGSKLLNETFQTNQVVFEFLSNKYSNEMKLVQELQILQDEKRLRWSKQPSLEGTYIGQVNELNEREGRGFFVKKESNVFWVGYWNKNKKERMGRLYNSNMQLICEGEYKNNMLNGKGIEIKEDGSKFEGYFKNDKKYGKGTMTFPDGSKWDGYFVNGNMDGTGKYIDIHNNEKERTYKNGILVSN